jgi:hypothetical protein
MSILNDHVNRTSFTALCIRVTVVIRSQPHCAEDAYHLEPNVHCQWKAHVKQCKQVSKSDLMIHLHPRTEALHVHLMPSHYS